MTGYLDESPAFSRIGHGARRVLRTHRVHEVGGRVIETPVISQRAEAPLHDLHLKVFYTMPEISPVSRRGWSPITG